MEVWRISALGPYLLNTPSVISLSRYNFFIFLIQTSFFGSFLGVFGICQYSVRAGLVPESWLILIGITHGEENENDIFSFSFVSRTSLS